MNREHVVTGESLKGYDTLQRFRASSDTLPGDWAFTPEKAYKAYFRMHKGFVNESGAQKLQAIADSLKDREAPQYLKVAGWAAAEAALVRESAPAAERMDLLYLAENSWERAMMIQEQINNDPSREWLHDTIEQYRTALNIAFLPIMKAIVAGNVTDSVLERVFADTLAIAEVSAIQSNLAATTGNLTALADHIGFGYECNALLTLLYMKDPRHIPLPSSERAGSGREYGDQTHDLSVVNQHWGKILKIIPVEVKSKTSNSDLRRYKSLIIRGKLHLSASGKYLPRDTLEAFSDMYDGTQSEASQATITHATSTMQELLHLYQKGERIVHPYRVVPSVTRFHKRNEVEKVYKEFTPNSFY